MVTHGYWHDFTVLILKCKEVMKIYRDHPYGLKLYCFVLPYCFYITKHSISDLHLYIISFINTVLDKDVISCHLGRNIY